MDKREFELLKKDFTDKKFHLSRWKSQKGNKNWSHDHCEICNKEISDNGESENEGYTDEKNFYWICKACFKKFSKELELKEK